MLYITGDTHRNIKRFMKGNAEFIHDMTWTKDDILIVCGDFGFVFYDTSEEHDMLDWLERTKPYIICFVDGNHENHPRIAKYDLEQWNGGNIHRIRKNIIHLMRGQVFTLQGHKIFTMGGAFSIDRAAKGDFWWKEEIPEFKELDEARTNLAIHNYEIDYCITHTAPALIVKKMGFNPNINEDRWLTDFLDNVYRDCRGNLKCWFFGHFHEERQFHGGVFRCLLDDVVSIEEVR